MKTIIKASILFVVLFLSGCGGGGGGAPASANNFNVLGAWQQYIAKGFNKTFSVSGYCNGSAVFQQTPAVAGYTFENIGAYKSTITLSITFSNCSPAFSVQTGSAYYNKDFMPIGYISDSKYETETPKFNFPTIGYVNQIGVYSSSNLYSNSTKNSLTGYKTNSFAIQPDSPTTALLNLSTAETGASPSTEQDVYRLNADGTLSLLSISFNYTANNRNLYLN